MIKLTLKDILQANNVDISNNTFADKNALFDHMADLLVDSKCVSDKQALLEALEKREQIGSTYMGEGLAVPHCTSACVMKASVIFCRCKPFLYVSGDAQGEVNLAVMLVTPDSADDSMHIKLLSRVARLLMINRFRNALETSDQVEEILAVGEEELTKLEAY